MLVFLITVSLLVSLVPTSNGLECYDCVNCSGLGTVKTCTASETFCQVIFLRKLKNFRKNC